MKEGWMWSDHDPKRSVEEKVALAIVAYREKLGHKPNACYLNSSHACLEQIGPVKVTHVPYILPNHFLLGREEKEIEPRDEVTNQVTKKVVGLPPAYYPLRIL